MKMPMFRAVLLGSVCFGFAGGALAQEAAPAAAPAATADESGLEEIVVTAQRRSENLQDVPIAVSAVSANVAKQLGISDPQNLTQLVPGFTFQRQASGATPFIRGVGSTSSFVGNEPSVAIFVDDTYIPTGNAAIFEFNNIDLVEVLKGPQGTLFGRNATGGVVHVHTRNPSFDTKGDVSLSYANFETVNGQAYVSTGLTDKIAMNASVFYVNQNEGWGKNVTTGNDILKNKSWGVRSKLLFEADDTTKVLLGGVYSKRKSDQGFATRVIEGFAGMGLTYPGAFKTPAQLGAGFYDGTVSRDQFYDTKFYQFSGKVTKEFDNATLVSITAYSKTKTWFEIDLDAGPAPVINSDVLNSGKTFTQELQLLSPSDSAVKWILGGFFLKDTSFFGIESTGVGIAQYAGASKLVQESTQKSSSISGFAQASTEILPRTTLTIGVRYTSDKRKEQGAYATAYLANGNVALTSPVLGSKRSFDALTGRFSLDYKFNDDLMGYVAFNRGFKSGVYNLPGTTPLTTTALAPANPEDLNAYTAGFKSELFDRRVRLNAEAFYYDFSNIQVQNNLPAGTGTILINGGAATIKGFDVDMSIVPVNNLTITANLAYAHGRYDSFANGPAFFPQAPNAQLPIPAGCGNIAYPTGGTPAKQVSCNLAGMKTVNTPPISTTLAVMYKLPTAVGDFDFASSWAHGGNYYSEPHNQSWIHQGKTDLVNASIKWTDTTETVDLRFWVNNLLKEEYYSYLAYGATSGAKGSPAAPRTYGVTLGAHF